MFEELRTYLDLVRELGDPFTVFERDWPEDEEESTGRHVLRDAFVADVPEPLPPTPKTQDGNSALAQVDTWTPGIKDLPVSDVGFPG